MPFPLHIAVAVGSVVTTLQASKVVANLYENIHHNSFLLNVALVECNTDRIEVEL